MCNKDHGQFWFKYIFNETKGSKTIYVKSKFIYSSNSENPMKKNQVQTIQYNSNYCHGNSLIIILIDEQKSFWKNKINKSLFLYFVFLKQFLAAAKRNVLLQNAAVGNMVSNINICSNCYNLKKGSNVVIQLFLIDECLIINGNGAK